jgi:hypothetical protein
MNSIEECSFSPTDSYSYELSVKSPGKNALPLKTLLKMSWNSKYTPKKTWKPLEF